MHLFSSKSNKIDVSSISVTIDSAMGISGIYPFIVVCFDNDITHELHKTQASTNANPDSNASIVPFNESFTFNLKIADKNRAADSQPPPKYLTFFLYDTGTQGIPSLGSAGVLLDTVRENGVAKGDFPVVNGTGILKLIVQAGPPGAGVGVGVGAGAAGQQQAYGQAAVAGGQQGYGQTVSAKTNYGTPVNQPAESESWYKSNGAKVAGVVGVGALAAAGVATALKAKKKKKNKPLPGQPQHNDADDADADIDNTQLHRRGASTDEEHPGE